jgi:hypothetical protein
MSKIIIPPSQNTIPLSYLDSIAKTDTLEVKGKACKDVEEAKNEMEKIVKENKAELNNAIAEEAGKQFGNHK